MTSRERLLTVLRGEVPDCVPVAPDFSNMIPAALTGKPFWDLYLYNDPPIWEAYIAAARHFGIDSLMDCHAVMQFPPEGPPAPPPERFIIQRSPDRIVVQSSRVEGGRRVWEGTVDVYRRADPPVRNVPAARLHLPEVPKRYEPLEGVKPLEAGPAALTRAKRLLGDRGLVGVGVVSSVAFANPEAVYEYFDNPDKHEHWARQRLEQAERRFARVMALEDRPDFLCVGGSGTLVFQTVEMFRRVAFPAVRRVIELAAAAGIPTHVHSCGPERELVKIFAEETALTSIDPLETPPMGDCDLAELKRLYGRRIVLKGNLHTTEVMLRGTPEGVAAAARKAIDDAAAGGRFILSTGDQCGRDTPHENLRAMIETARQYGRY